MAARAAPRGRAGRTCRRSGPPRPPPCATRPRRTESREPRPPRAWPPRGPRPLRAPARGRRAPAGALSPAARGRARPGSAGRAPPACGSCRTPPGGAGACRGARRARAGPPRARRPRSDRPALAPRLSGPHRSLRRLGLFLVDDLVVGLFDDLVVRRPGRAVAALRGGGRLLGRGLCVDGLGQLLRGLLERLSLRADLVDVLGLEHAPELHDPTLDRRGVRLLELVAVLLERALGLVRERLRGVARVGEFAQTMRVAGVVLGLPDHPLDLVLLQARAALDADLLLVARAEVLGGHVDDPVRVDVEGDLDLRHVPRRRRDADELELAERLVVERHLRLALEDVHLDRRLVVLRGRERLGLLRRDRRVALDQLREDATLRLDAERQRRDVEQEDVLDL